jgi:hypothetical protein
MSNGEPHIIDTHEQITMREAKPLAPLSGPAFTLARMSEEEFTEAVTLMQKGRERLQYVMRAMMKEGVHYGATPGADPNKKTLLKPGGEILCQMFSLVPNPVATVTYGDGITAPHISVASRCSVHAGSIDGPIVAIGEAAGSSWEKKYRYRSAQRICPNCKKTTIIKGQAKYGGGWLCWKKLDGCGAKWPDGAPEIESQVSGQVENSDPYEQLNTIVKITNKRAKQDAIIQATHSSDLFTQDIGDPETEDDPTSDPAPREPLEKPVFAVPFGKHKGTAIGDLTLMQLEWYIAEAKANLALPLPRNRDYNEKAWLTTIEAQASILKARAKDRADRGLPEETDED